VIRNALILLLCACGPDWDVPPHIAFQRQAGAKHRACIENNLCQYVMQCHAESEQYCVANGYSPSCGNDFGDIEGSCGTGVK